MLLMKSLIIIPCTFDEQKINMIQKQCLLGDPLLNLLHKICKKKRFGFSAQYMYPRDVKLGTDLSLNLYACVCVTLHKALNC